MHKVVILKAMTLDGLETKINKALGDLGEIELVDIKFNSGAGTYCHALIIYKLKPYTGKVM